MKFTDYIEESSKYDLQVYGIVQSLKKNCAPFIKELRKSGKNFIWRGTNKVSKKTIVQLTPRQDRSPKDMPTEIHDELDERFYKKYGWRPRSEGVFTSPIKNHAKTYGEAYMFFPVGKYEYLYNPKIDDLFSYIEGEPSIYDVFTNDDDLVSTHEEEYYNMYGENSSGTWHYLGTDTYEQYEEDAYESAAESEGINVEDLNSANMEWMPDVEIEDFISEKQEELRSEAEDLLNEIINNYRGTNLALATRMRSEIMFRCKKYYLVHEKFEHSMTEYILKDKPMKFNPKQKGLPFYRDPDWRKGGQVKINKGDPFTDTKDWQVSGMGHMAKHSKYQSLLKKSKKGYQLPDSLI